jgi:hypothetical protein
MFFMSLQCCFQSFNPAQKWMHSGNGWGW